MCVYVQECHAADGNLAGGGQGLWSLSLTYANLDAPDSLSIAPCRPGASSPANLSYLRQVVFPVLYPIQYLQHARVSCLGRKRKTFWDTPEIQ